jgi:hypothetical protein
LISLELRFTTLSPPRRYIFAIQTISELNL